MAQYSLFVLKLPLNPKQTNKRHIVLQLYFVTSCISVLGMVYLHVIYQGLIDKPTIYVKVPLLVTTTTAAAILPACFVEITSS